MHTQMKEYFLDPREVKSPTQIQSFITRMAAMRKLLGMPAFDTADRLGILEAALLEGDDFEVTMTPSSGDGCIEANIL